MRVSGACVRVSSVRGCLERVLVDCSVLQCVTVCCRMLQCAAVCNSVLQCVAVCCSVLQCIAVDHVYCASDVHICLFVDWSTKCISVYTCVAKRLVLQQHHQHSVL